MARPRRFDDDALLQCARDLFLQHGPSVSTSRIAQEMGISQASIFKRFSTKEGLLIAALSPSVDPHWLQELNEGPSEAPFPEQLENLNRSLLAYLVCLVPRIATLKASGIDTHKMMARYPVPPPIRAQIEISHWLERAYAQGLIKEIPFNATSLLIMGPLHQAAFVGHAVGVKPDPDLPETLSRLIWSMLDPKK